VDHRAPHPARAGRGRRAGGVNPANLERLRFDVLPPPYEELVGELDGRAVFESGVLGGPAIWD